MLVVVVAEEPVAEGPGVLDGTEALGERRAVFEGLELALAERVVVGHVRAGVAAADAQEGQQLSDRAGGHRAAAIGMDGELAGQHLVAGHGVGDQFAGELAGLRRCYAPGDDVAAEDVQHHIQVVVLAAAGSLELGDVPAPHGIRHARDQLGADPRRVRCLAPPLADLTAGAQQPVERRHRRQVGALIEQDVEYLRRGQVHEPGRVQDAQHAAGLGGGELVRRHRQADTRAGPGRRRVPVMGGAGAPDRGAGRLGAQQRLDRGKAFLDHGCRLVSSLSASSRSKSSDAFPWISSASLWLAS